MKAVLKWVGIVVGVIVGLLILGILVLYGRGQMRLNKKYVIPAQTVAIPTDARISLEGKRIFQYRGCEACHGEELQGLVYLDNPAMGKLSLPISLLDRAVSAHNARTRTWSAPSSMVFARTEPRYCSCHLLEFYYLSDKDLGNVLAYIRSMPPVDNTMPPVNCLSPGLW